MGSRYGGLKQLDALGPHGETIMDYSVYDAILAGFGKIVFVIREDFEEDFRQKILSRYRGRVALGVVNQSNDALPEGYVCPEGRCRPWGTNHAVLMGKGVIREPFAVINADDFYGRQAFEVIARELERPRRGKGDYCMVGFKIGNTVTENGTVSRGVCTIKNGNLESIVERTAIGYNAAGEISYNDPQGAERLLDPSTIVSMNFWGFTPDYFDYSEEEFVRFLDKNLNDEKAEFFIPSCVDALIRSGKAAVRVLDTDSEWFGVTYLEDKPGVARRLAELHADGTYPQNMLG